MPRFLLVAALAALALAGCGSSAKRNDARYERFAEIRAADLEAEREDQRARAARFEAMMAKCTDARCVETVASYQALVDVAGKAGGSGADKLPAPPYERDGAAKFRDVAAGAAPIVGAVVAGAVNWRQSDNAVRLNESNNTTQRALYDGAFGMGSTALENAGDRYDIGGNLGNTYGDNTTFGNREETNVSTTITADNGGVAGDGNQVANGQNGFNSGEIRQESPGPIDDRDGAPGGDCDGGSEEAAGGDCSGGNGGG